MKPLTETELATWLQEEPDWKIEDGRLVRDWSFRDFVGSMFFVNRIAAFAEQSEHHPDIDIRFNRVRLGLITHDAGGITKRDLDFASALRDPVLAEGSGSS